MNILVTGGAGYIGAHACMQLAAAGHQPIVYDNLSEGQRQAVQWGPFIQGDLHDSSTLRQVFGDYAIDAVMHFAARAYVGESVRDPARYYHTNVSGSVALLAAMREASVELLIFSSSCATYGIPASLPISETTPQQPINPYGRSKWMVEQILADYQAAYGLHYAALRYFNVVGSDPQGRIGECHDPETHLIPLVIGAALGSQPPLKIFGDDYPTPDGSAVRDYVHVLDVVDAHIRALEYLDNQRQQQAAPCSLQLNLSSGQGASVLEVIAQVEAVLGRKVPYSHAPRRPGDPAALVANAARAQEILGWRSHYSLEQSIRHSAQWLQQRLATTQ